MGLCLSGVLPDGVWSEWDFAQWGFALDSGLPSQTSRTNNKRVISTFKFDCPHLTLKEGSKVKSDHTNRFPGNDFLYVGLPSQVS